MAIYHFYAKNDDRVSAETSTGYFLLKWPYVTNMARKKRYIVIGILAFLFLITAPLIICYSLGWRIDFRSLNISQPGIFYFKVFPNSVQIFVNGKMKKKTDFLFGSAMIENLSPSEYDVELIKDGFFSWKKKLQIKKGTATEVKNTILFPKNPQIKMVSGNIDEIFMSSNGKTIITKETDAKTKTWSLKMLEPKNNLKSALVEEKDFLSKAGLKIENVSSAEIKEVKFSENERTALIKMAIKEKLKAISSYYFILETDNSPPTLTLLDFLKQSVIKAEFNPISDKKLGITYVQPKTKQNQSQVVLAEADLNLMKIIDAKISDVLDFSSFNGNYYYLDDSGFIYKTDASFTLPNKMNSKPMDIKSGADYEIKASSFGIAVKEDRSLYFFDIKKGEMKNLSDDIDAFSFSKNIYKMAYWGNSAGILFMDKENYQPQKMAGDEILIADFNEKITELLWLNDFYVIFNIGNQIKIAETDDRDQINIIDFASYPDPQIFWNRSDRVFYVFSSSSLYSFENLIP